jgi:hypothetical protein
MSHRTNKLIRAVPFAGFRWDRVGPRRQTGRASHDWEEINSLKPGWYLVSKGGTLRDYDLSERPDLFRVFAGIKPDRAHIRKFANQYGHLGGGKLIAGWPGDILARPPLYGESFETWTRYIKLMKELIHLWDLCERDAIEDLARHIRWSDDGSSVSYSSRPIGAMGGNRGKMTLIACRTLGDSLGSPGTASDFDRLTPSDVVLPALFFIQAQVNDNLEYGTPSRLVWDLDCTLRTKLEPGSLLNVLFQQFADAIDGRMGCRACPACGREIPFHTGTGGTSRVYCSNACRLKSHRSRQDTARRLHAAGESLASIAAQLESSENAVTRWVTGARADGSGPTSRTGGKLNRPDR